MDFYNIFNDQESGEEQNNPMFGFSGQSSFNDAPEIHDASMNHLSDNTELHEELSQENLPAEDFSFEFNLSVEPSPEFQNLSEQNEMPAEFISVETVSDMQLENTPEISAEVENSWQPVLNIEEHVSNKTEMPVSELPEITDEFTLVADTPFEPTAEDPLGLVGNNADVLKPVAEIETTQHTIINNQTESIMTFDLPKHSSIIKVIGVGGGGSNAVNHMYKLGIRGVDFIVCNTDKQALDMSPVPHKIVLGATLTEGRGAGAIPEVGRNAAIENIEDIRALLSNNTKMLFITAGMGGGTGTGAAPIIAKIAREMGILTVAIVTVPFAFEGKKRRTQAEEGLEQLKQNVDTLLVICNDKLREMYGNLKLSEAFGHADDVLTTAAKSIAEIISITQQINVDFADVCTVMRDSGVAIMGSAVVSGENRAVRAVEMALNSPLLNDNNIIGARYVLLNIISGSTEITMDELGEITDYIQEAAGQTAEIIKGYGVDETLGDAVSVTIIATGFNQTNPVAYEYTRKPEMEIVVRQLDENKVSSEPVNVVNEEPKQELNPLEPFLVSKQPEVQSDLFSEPVAEEKPNEIEFEITNTVVAEEVNVVNEVSVNEIAASESEEIIEPVAQNESTEPFLIKKEAPVAEVKAEDEAKKVMADELQRKAQERVQKLKELSLKLKTQQGLSEMEKEPAFKRRNIQLENVPHSSESQVSRFTLTETEDKKIEIRPNNSFLHDNVD
ncbi:MAG: cell division protein FtsZ [Bacteroidia bacterium]